MKLTRYGLSWEGEMLPSPHGDYYSTREVLLLEDELDALRGRLAAIEAEKDAELAARLELALVAPVAVPAADLGLVPAGKKFGFLPPEDAQKFLRGEIDKVTVYRRKSALRCFQTDFTETPSSMIRPKVGKVVSTEVGVGTVVFHPKRGIVIRKQSDGKCATAMAWNYDLGSL